MKKPEHLAPTSSLSACSWVAVVVIGFCSVWAWSGVDVAVIEANGVASAILSRAGVVVLFFTIEASPEGINQIMWILRPSKLTGVATSLSRQAPGATNLGLGLPGT